MQNDKELQRKTGINLKPINKGLGLDHFSETGLPYAKHQIKPKPMVRFNFPPQVKAEPVKQEAIEPEKINLNAGMIRRSLAFIMDVAFTYALFYFIIWGSFSFNGYALSTIMNQGFQILFPLCLLYFVIYMGYFLIQELTWRKTLGKALFGIEIKSHSGFAAAGRAFCFFLSAIPFGLGLLMVFFDSKKRCWHDFITDSEVILQN